MEDAHTSEELSFLSASSHVRCIHRILNNVDYLDEEKKIPWESQTLEQVTQRSCDISILRGVQDSTKQVPEQPDLIRPSLRR